MRIPTDAAGLDTFLADRKNVEQAIMTSGGLRQLAAAATTAYANDPDPPDGRNWRNGVKRLPFEGPAGHNRSIVNRQIAHGPGAPGAVLDSEWEDKGIADFCRSIDPRTIERHGLPQSLRNDMSSVIGADGGFLIPEILREQILQTSLETSVVRSRAVVLPMSSLVLLVPALDEKSHVTSVMGGVTASWVEESSTLAATIPAFARLRLQAKKLAVFSIVPNELLADDGGALDILLSTGFASAVSWYEDSAFLVGSGVGQPLGILNSPALVSVAKETGQPAATILWENIVNMWGRVLPVSRGRGVWVASQSCIAQLFTMSLSIGTAGNAIFIQNGSAAAPPTLLGRPLIFTEHLPAVGTVGDIMFIDFGYYLIGDRQAISMAVSADYKFANDQTAFRLIERADGIPWLLSPLTPQNGGATLSAFVAIATRA
jgi:HK97 family phage major capsid protein